MTGLIPTAIPLADRILQDTLPHYLDIATNTSYEITNNRLEGDAAAVTFIKIDLQPIHMTGAHTTGYMLSSFGNMTQTTGN